MLRVSSFSSYLHHRYLYNIIDRYTTTNKLSIFNRYSLTMLSIRNTVTSDDKTLETFLNTDHYSFNFGFEVRQINVQ